MAHGGGHRSEPFEPPNGFADLDISGTDVELRGSSFKRVNISIGGRAGVSSIDDVFKLLECPVCAHLIYPPIYQCPNGHALCFQCKARVESSCPTCRDELGNIRCLAQERAAESLELPCRYRSTGCHETSPYYNKLKHEASCRFRPFNCPYSGSECPISGDIPFLVLHLKEEHMVDMHDGCTFSHRYVKLNPQEVENATWMLTVSLSPSMHSTCLEKSYVKQRGKRNYLRTQEFNPCGAASAVFNCFGRNFCLHFEAFMLGTAPVYIAFLMFMGDEHDAKKFQYTLEVGDQGRKLSWQGIKTSIRDSHRKVRDSLDGLIIHRSLGLFFSEGDDQQLKLKVTGRIWKEQ